ncbi:MAG: extracellular solute-binding protein [Clostridiales bacterium]|nr:extracellular solute-binding protein [Clostridiales bacterium]
MNKKKTAVALTAVLVAASLVGCGGVNQTKNAESDKVQISVGEWPTENRPIEQEKYEGYLKTMNEKYPDIEVTPDEWAYDVQTFLPKASSGQLPTMYTCYLTETKKIINAGYSADITSILDELGYSEYLKKDIMDLCEKDGKFYGIPQDYYKMGLACNVELFKKAGLVDENGVPKFPQTWEEVAETAKTIKEKTGQPGFVLPTINNCGGWHFMNIAWSYGVEFMKQDGNKWVATFDSPECVAALQFVKDLKWKYNALPDNTLIDNPEMQKLFAVDQGAMYMTIGADVALTETYGMPTDRFSFTKMPAGPKGRYSLMGGKTRMFSPDATQQQLDACFKWLDVAANFRPALTDEEQNAYLEKTKSDLQTQKDQGYIVYSASTGIWEIPGLTEKVEALGKEMANIDYKLVETSMDDSDVTVKPEEPMNCQDLYSILDSCIQAVLTDENADPAQLVKEANAAFQKNYLDKTE